MRNIQSKREQEYSQHIKEEYSMEIREEKDESLSGKNEIEELDSIKHNIFFAKKKVSSNKTMNNDIDNNLTSLNKDTDCMKEQLIEQKKAIKEVKYNTNYLSYSMNSTYRSPEKAKKFEDN